MASRSASSQPAPMAVSQHTSGIFSDMTVDGPEIGTLVIIVDRAKNLPNRKALGKQNPYCAARLGKEAKKTETDKRGGQTPRWDQELRFVVHDSLDYHNLKVSVFSEDKKTDLVGEAWVNLDNVITAGGGKCDLWQTLNCKGKYSGEIRIELTYYDSRPRPEKKMVQDEALPKQSGSDRPKRRPLPNGPAGAARGALTPATIPALAVPGRARHGPREIQAIRTNSLPLETVQHQAFPPQQQTQAAQPFPPQQIAQPAQTMYTHEQHQHSSMPHMPHMQSEPNLPTSMRPQHEETYTDLRTHSEPYEQPDFLPILPPSNRQRAGPPQELDHAPMYAHPLARHTNGQGLPHAHSDPIVPQQQDFHSEMDMQTTLYTNAPEPLRDLDYQHSYVQQRQNSNDAAQHWDPQSYDEPYNPPQRYQQPPQQSYHHHHAPPLPPVHSRSLSSLPMTSHSTPTTPRDKMASDYSRTSPSARPVSRGQQQYISNVSPLQSIERGRVDHRESTGYQPLPRDDSEPSFHSSPNFQSSPIPAHQRHSPYNTPPQRRGPPPATDPAPHRHSISTPYAPQGLRQSPHPLSQEIPRARSPIPEFHEPSYAAAPPFSHNDDDRHQVELNRTAITPVVRPRAISPSRQTASDGPRRNDWRPKNTYSIQSPVRAFESSDDSPLSYSRPRDAASTVRKSVSPHPSPAQPRVSAGVPYGPDSFDIHNPTAAISMARDAPPSGPITGWDGREIDPSDHLPVASWAPEPEAKTPNKTYGLGRDRDFGPRSAEPASPHFSRDTVVNVHRKGASADTTPSNTIRARLVKKSQPPAPSPHFNANGSPVQPLSEHPNYNPVPDPYTQHDYSRGYMDGGAAYQAPHKPRFNTDYGGGQGYGHGPPELPPKVPIDFDQAPDSYRPDALSREIARIDIGAGSRNRASVPAPSAYVPVRSHRDRDNYY